MLGTEAKRDVEDRRNSCETNVGNHLFRLVLCLEIAMRCGTVALMN